MKNKSMIIVLIILLLIIVIGLTTFLVLAITGKWNKFEMIRFKAKSDEIVFEEIYELEEINDIKILSDMGDITFKESTDNNIKIVIYGKDKDDLKVTTNERNLEINYTIASKMKLFSFNWYKNDIIVYIPHSYSNIININNDYGDCKIDNLEKATINIKSDCGSIEIKKAKNVNLECDYGSIKIEDILNKCKIEADCGDIKIENAQIKENSSIKCNLGDVKISNINDIYIDANVDLGDVKIKNNNRHSDITLKIESNLGDIKIGE